MQTPRSKTKTKKIKVKKTFESIKRYLLSMKISINKQELNFVCRERRKAQGSRIRCAGV
jgi:hypothetical protein